MRRRRVVAVAQATQLMGWRRAPAVIWLVSAVLILWHLDHTALWHDEASVAGMGRQILQGQGLYAFDGRNLWGGANGVQLNAELVDTFPPLMYLLTAAGFALFGYGEFGARVLHAVAGTLALGLFHRVLHQHIGERARLIVFCFAFAAFNAQLMLHFRSARYYALSVLTVVAMMWAYERWWRGGRTPSQLAVLALSGVAVFFSQYAIGVAAMLALATMHCIVRGGETRKLEWAGLALAGAAACAVGIAWLGWLGVLGDSPADRAIAWAHTSDKPEWGAAAALRQVAVYGWTLFSTDWISWPVALWLAVCATAARIRAIRLQRGAGMDPGFAGAGRLILFGILFTVAVAVVGPQDPGRTVANVPLRYMLPAIVFVLVLKGLFCEWVWRRNRYMGVVALAGLLLTNAAAWPLHIRNADTGASSAGYPLWNYVKFVTRLYPDPLKRASLWLAQNAGEDDNVYVAGKPDMENVTWYAGGRVRICCYIDAMSELPETTVAALPAPLRRGPGGYAPDWIVLGAHHWPKGPEVALPATAQFEGPWTKAAKFGGWPTQSARPELNRHLPEPPHVPEAGILILRRK